MLIVAHVVAKSLMHQQKIFIIDFFDYNESLAVVVVHLCKLSPSCFSARRRREGDPALGGAEAEGGHCQSSHPPAARPHPGRGHQRPGC